MLSCANWIRLCVPDAVMTIGSLAANQIGEDHGGAVVAATTLLRLTTQAPTSVPQPHPSPVIPSIA